MLITSIFSFSNNGFLPSQKEFLFLNYIYLLSANASNLDKSKILLFGKEIKSQLQVCISGQFSFFSFLRNQCCLGVFCTFLNLIYDGFANLIKTRKLSLNESWKLPKTKRNAR